MLKRLVALAVAIVILLSFAACGDAIKDYKSDAKDSLASYANSKGEDNYSLDNWTTLLGRVEEGKMDIDTATSKEEVDNALNRAKEFIDGVLTKQEVASIQLANYKESIKTELQQYFDQKDENDYSDDNWDALLRHVEDGKMTIDSATNKGEVDTANMTAKESIMAVQARTVYTFPSILEELDLTEFTDEFFEDYTLILVPITWFYVLHDYLDFYAVFVEEGQMNFLIEITYPPDKLRDWSSDYYVFAIFVPNTLLDKYEIGECRIFETYTFEYENYTVTSREFLNVVERNSVEHRVSYIADSGYQYELLKKWPSDITIISSIQDLSEYFYI